MMNIKNKVFFFITSVAVILGLSTFPRTNLINNVDGLKTYDIVLNAANAPTTITSGNEANNQIKGVNFYYSYASSEALKHINLGPGGGLENTNQITSIKSIQVVFTGIATLYTGPTYSSRPNSVTLSSGTAVTFTTNLPYYFFIFSQDPCSFTSVTITYTCIPLPV